MIDSNLDSKFALLNFKNIISCSNYIPDVKLTTSTILLAILVTTNRLQDCTYAVKIIVACTCTNYTSENGSKRKLLQKKLQVARKII